ncbi:MAG: heat shock 70 family protein, partial [Deltaproteobacteria bacterium]|nr:heat shock 70 family protein [Deltaproteobacteria bacterium]
QEAVKKSMENAKLGIDDIDRIILVGGSSRVPLVKRMISDIFAKESYGDLDPDTVVATGAAIFGAWLGVPSDKLDVTEIPDDADRLAADIRLQNKVTHFLGIEIQGGRFSKLIDKGAELTDEAPVISAEKEYTTSRDEQTELRITVYQATEDVEYVRDEGCVCIGEFFLTGIPKALRGRERITVRFEINQQNLLKVIASSKGTDTISKSLEIQRQ